MKDLSIALIYIIENLLRLKYLITYYLILIILSQLLLELSFLWDGLGIILITIIMFI